MKVIYVAGAFTAPTPWDIEKNVRKAEEVGFMVAQVGAMPLIPHANTRFFHGQQTPQYWYDGTMELLKRCDAVIMVPGWEKSRGSVVEHAYAGCHNMQIFYADAPTIVFGLMKKWVEEQDVEHHVQDNFDRELSLNCGEDQHQSEHTGTDPHNGEEPG